MKKEEIIALENKTKELFIKANIKIPTRTLPTIIFDGMTPEHCFAIRMRTLTSQIRIIKQDTNGNKCLVKDDEGEKQYQAIRRRTLTLTGIDITQIDPFIPSIDSEAIE